MLRHSAKVIVFTVILLVIAYLINSLLLQGLRTIKIGEYGDWNRIIRGQAKADILIAGSSRAMAHFDAPLITLLTGEKCFNIGLNGTGLAMEYPMLLTYIKYSGKPKIVIEELNIRSFSEFYYEYDSETYLPYLNEDDVYKSLKTLDHSVWRNRYIPLYTFAQYGLKLTGRSVRNLLGRYSDNRIAPRYDGYVMNERKWTDEFDKFKKQYPGGIRYKIISEAVVGLEKTIRTLKEKGIEVILVYSPEYYESYKLTLNRDDIFKIFKDIAKKHDIPFWDYTGIPLSFSKEYFTNSQHLNMEGASKFSSMFAKRLKQYMAGRGLSQT